MQKQLLTYTIVLLLTTTLLFTNIILGMQDKEIINHKTIIGSEKIGEGTLIGPESLVWDKTKSYVAYTGIGDGSIRRIDLDTGAISIFAYDVPSLNESVRASCGIPLNEKTCGRPLGMVVDHKGDLLVADAYLGILKIPKAMPSKVQVLVNSYQGVPFRFTNSLVLLSDNRTIYFTDTSTQYYRSQFVTALISSNPDGRLFKFDLITKDLKLVLDDLQFANGIALSEYERFLVINECSARKIRRYWLKGTKQGFDEVFVKDIGGYNDNIVNDGNGGFLVGLYSETSDAMSAIQKHGDLAALIKKYIPPLETLNLIQRMGLVKRIDSKGKVKEIIEDETGLQASAVSEAHEHNGYLYLCSVINNYLTRVNKFKDLH